MPRPPQPENRVYQPCRLAGEVLQPFRLRGGPLDGASPLILSSPHSGTALPMAFQQTLRLPMAAIRRIEDSHVGALLADVHRAPLIEAVVSRAVIDVNRAADEIDPQLFDAAVCPHPRLSDRVRRGHGLFARTAADGHQIHAGLLSAATARHWVETLYHPWHQAIAAGLAESRAVHGYGVLLDMHSMPSLAGRQPAQIVLGDRRGGSASSWLVGWLHQRFAAAGFRVTCNQPYAGGHITEQHGRPATGIHAVQIEIDRALYMDQQSGACHAGFSGLAAFLAALIDDLVGSLPALGLWPPGEAQAAE